METKRTIVMENNQCNYFPIRVNNVLVLINPDNIIRMEGYGSYSRLYTDDEKRYISSKNLKEFENSLRQSFFRIHKSHLINIKKVIRFIDKGGFYAEMKDGVMIEISRRKKKDFFRAMCGHVLV